MAEFLMWRVFVVAVAVGLVGLAVSCFNTDNPEGLEDVYMGYPFYAFIGSRSLLISFPPIPVNVVVLWSGLAVDLLLYTGVGWVLAFLVFSLRENVRLVKFLVKGGGVFLLVSFPVLTVLAGASSSPYGSVPPVFIAGLMAVLFSVVAACVTTVLYGYYLLFKKRKLK